MAKKPKGRWYWGMWITRIDDAQEWAWAHDFRTTPDGHNIWPVALFETRIEAIALARDWRKGIGWCDIRKAVTKRVFIPDPE